MKIKKIMILLIFSYVLFYTAYSFKSTTSSAYVDIYLDKQSFLDDMVEPAIQEMKESGVYASVTLAQAVIEGGWNSSSLSSLHNNHFGVTVSGSVYVNGVKTSCTQANTGQVGDARQDNGFWHGKAVCYGTREQKTDGTEYYTYRWFRAYDSALDSIKDHSRVLWCIGDDRYIKNGVFNSADGYAQIKAIAASGYATALNYCSAVSSVIRDNNFTQYDVGYKAAKPDYANACSSTVYTGPTLTENCLDGLNYTTNTSTSYYTTSYTGDIKKGYINLNQKDNALIYRDNTSEESIKDKVFNIINKIFGRAGEYNGATSSSKPGASAYIANVSYLSGTFKNKIIYHNQGDYLQPYGSYGTIKSHGCGPTSMAIVISSFRGQAVSPVETTNWACSNGYCSSNGSYHSVICALAIQYGLKCSGEIDSQSTEGQQRVVNALASGDSLVVVLAGPGYFTGGGHFFVVTGIDASGNITVADPGSRTRTSKPYTFNQLVNPTQGHARKFWIISE